MKKHAFQGGLLIDGTGAAAIGTSLVKIKLLMQVKPGQFRRGMKFIISAERRLCLD